MANKLAEYIPQPAGQGQPQYSPRLGIRGWLENLSARVGQGQVNALAGLLDTVKHPVQTGRGLLAAAANPGPTINALAGYYGDKINEGPLGIAELVGENLSPRSLLGVNPALKAMGPGMMQEITTYHGSPHRINNVSPDAPMGKFDLSKVGTGEGAQAYGHGIYLAESPGVAKSYVMSGTNGMSFKGLNPDDYGMNEATAKRIAKNWFDYKDTNPNEFHLFRVAEPKTGADKILNDIIDKKIEKGGHFYTVDLPDEHVAKMLDWDKPLSEQPAFQAAAARAAANTSDRAVKSFWERAGSPKADNFWQNGAEFYRSLNAQFANQAPAHLSLDAAENTSQAATSKALNAIGIPGIRYLDGGSRGAGEGTRNFVIFDPDVAKILKRE